MASSSSASPPLPRGRSPPRTVSVARASSSFSSPGVALPAVSRSTCVFMWTSRSWASPSTDGTSPLPSSFSLRYAWWSASHTRPRMEATCPSSSSLLGPQTPMPSQDHRSSSSRSLTSTPAWTRTVLTGSRSPHCVFQCLSMSGAPLTSASPHPLPRPLPRATPVRARVASLRRLWHGPVAAASRDRLADEAPPAPPAAAMAAGSAASFRPAVPGMASSAPARPSTVRHVAHQPARGFPARMWTPTAIPRLSGQPASPPAATLQAAPRADPTAVQTLPPSAPSSRRVAPSLASPPLGPAAV